MSPDDNPYFERLRGAPPPDPDSVLPGWAGIATLFGSPARHEPLESDEIVAAGVPFDATAGSRPGAAEGPLAIRAASRIMAAQLASLGTHRMYDTRTGEEFEYASPPICDIGDIAVYPTDPLRTFDAVATRAAQLADPGRRLVFLGGDHSIAFPLFAGTADAAAGDLGEVGYVQVDNHFDFGQTSVIHGELYHGSNARRISELPGFELRHMAFVGVGHPTKAEQHRMLLAEGCQIVPAATVARLGPLAALEPVLAAMADCRTVYLSLDIDVLESAAAPGTGSVTIGGLDPATLLDLLLTLRALPIGAIDVVEVAPRYDPSGRTAQLAAQILFDFLFRVAD